MALKSDSARFVLVWTATFERTARKFLRRHPELEVIFEDLLRQLEIDPNASRLRLHSLHGKHRGKHAVSLTYEHRIVLVLHLKASEIVFLDAGTHDVVY